MTATLFQLLKYFCRYEVQWTDCEQTPLDQRTFKTRKACKEFIAAYPGRRMWFVDRLEHEARLAKKASA